MDKPKNQQLSTGIKTNAQTEFHFEYRISNDNPSLLAAFFDKLFERVEKASN